MEHHVTDESVEGHSCPVCGAEVQHVHRPGRARIYCTNSCRQRAYRWRRARGIRRCVERDGPTERLFNDRRHALRDERDPVSRLRDGRQREVAVCGTFAKPVRSTRTTHDRFIPEHEWSCATCVALVGAGPPGTGIPDAVRPYFASAYYSPVGDEWRRGAPPPGTRSTTR